MSKEREKSVICPNNRESQSTIPFVIHTISNMYFKRYLMLRRKWLIDRNGEQKHCIYKWYSKQSCEQIWKKKMTCGVKKIGLWVKINRHLMVLAKEHHTKYMSFARNFSSSTDSNTSKTGESTVKKNRIKDIPDDDIQKSVFISQSHDIFTNLAFEDWLYRNFDFTKHHVLMLWSNDPCVVVGRHQNPWVLIY